MAAKTEEHAKAIPADVLATTTSNKLPKSRKFEHVMSDRGSGSTLSLPLIKCGRAGSFEFASRDSLHLAKMAGVMES